MTNFETQLLLNLNEFEFDTSHELTVEEIKSRYKKLSLHYHPDHNNNEIFRDKQKKINSSKEFLLDNLEEINRYIRRINHKETDEDKARAEKEQWQNDERARRAYYEQQARQKQENAKAEQEKAKAEQERKRAEQEKARAEQKARAAEREAEEAKARAAEAEWKAHMAENARREAESKRKLVKTVIIALVAIFIGMPVLIGAIMAGVEGFNEGMESDRQSEAAADKESRTMQITDTNLPKTVIKGAKLNWSDYYVTYKDKDGKDVKVTLSDGMVSIDYEKFEEQKAEININNGSVYLYHKLTVLNSNLISSVEDLKSIANDPKGTYLLDSDIDLSGTEWTPIAGFEGKLIGNGHTIKNLTITKLTAKNAGLFDTIGEKATVSDLKLENVSISFTSSAESVGALTGILNGSVENITVTGKIESVGSSAVGGVIGATGYLDSVIGNCSFDGTVIGGNGVGGILGGSAQNGDAIIDGCTSSGNISGTSMVGGIAGALTSPGDGKIFDVKNCTNNAKVSSKIDYCGGIVGKIENSTSWGPQVTGIIGCENNGEINGGSYTSGIIGYMHIGGGMGGGATVDNNVNKASVTGKIYTGGIIGWNDYTVNITSAQNLGVITGDSYVGGIVGHGNYTTLNGITNEQSVNGLFYVGGIAGLAEKCIDCNNTATITATSYDVERSATGLGGIAGLLDAAERCTNSGDIFAKSGYGVGGIVGVNATADRKGEYINCKNDGKITVDGGLAKGVGGIIGVFSQSGLRMNTLSISGCESAGAINVSNGDSIGGIIGYLKTTDNATINACTTTAGVNASNCTSVSGIVGLFANPKNRLPIKIETVTVRGVISGKSAVGAIIGTTAKAPENYETVRVTYTVENNTNLPNIGAKTE